MKRIATQISKILLIFIISAICFAGCNMVIGNPTEAPNIMPTNFSSVSELVQERAKVMGKQSDIYNLSSLRKIFVPKIFNDSTNGLAPEQFSVTEDYYLFDFTYKQDESILNSIADIYDNHFYLTHFQFIVRRDLWTSQEFFETKAIKYPDEYQLVEHGGQDYFISTSKNEEKGSDAIICRTVHWIKSDTLFQMNVPGTISIDDILKYFELTELTID